MTWIAPTEKDTVTETLEKRLWASADQFRANSGLKAQARDLEATIARNVGEILQA